MFKSAKYLHSKKNRASKVITPTSPNATTSFDFDTKAMDIFPDSPRQPSKENKRSSYRFSFTFYGSQNNSDVLEVEEGLQVSPLSGDEVNFELQRFHHTIDYLILKGHTGGFSAIRKTKLKDVQINLVKRTISVSKSKLESDTESSDKNIYQQYRSANVEGIKICKSTDKKVSKDGSGASFYITLKNNKEEMVLKWKFSQIDTAKEVERVIQTMNALGPRLLTAFDSLRSFSSDTRKNNKNGKIPKETDKDSKYWIRNVVDALALKVQELVLLPSITQFPIENKSNNPKAIIDSSPELKEQSLDIAKKMMRCISKVKHDIASRYEENQAEFRSTLSDKINLTENGGTKEPIDIQGEVENHDNMIDSSDLFELSYRDFFMFFVNMNCTFYLDIDPIVSWYMFTFGQGLSQRPPFVSPPRSLGLTTPKEPKDNKDSMTQTNFTGLSEITFEEWKPILLEGEELINTLSNIICIINPHINTQIKSQGYLFITTYRLYFIATTHELHSNVIDIPESFSRFSIPYGMIETIEKSVHIHKSDYKNPNVILSPMSGETTTDLGGTIDISSTTNNDISSALSNTTDYIKILSKDLRCCCFAFRDNLDNLDAICSHIENLSFLQDQNAIKKCFAFNYRMDTKNEEKPIVDGWNIYNPIQEYSRLGFIGENAPLNPFDSNKYLWSLYCDDYNLSPTYPMQTIIPSIISPENLQKAAKYRSRQRFPTGIWRSQNTGAVLLRCSQPLVGMIGKRSELDEKLLDIYRCQGQLINDRNLIIVDCRKAIAAMGNQVQGKGTENMDYYKFTELIYCNIENIHVMRSSLQGVCALMTKSQETLPSSVLFDEPDTIYSSNGGNKVTIEDDSNYMDYYGGFLESGWLTHLSMILRGSLVVAEKLHIHGCSVVIHCSDGWDRTPQLTATAQLLLDNYYRTIEGFAVLIEKEWCSFGHKFEDRCGHFSSKSKTSQERSPCFVQWLDVVHQVLKQFPYKFEFNESLLLFLADHVYSGLYGNFLGNTEKERLQDLNVEEETVSIWTIVLMNRDIFTNVDYCKSKQRVGEDAIWPSANIKKLQLWERYFLRGDAALQPRKNSGIVWPDLLNLTP